ncbi:response regulator MprA [Geobacter sp. OR-1]|uniref:DUF4388 domain-containing protein n=1 Tax=Geobacter sp. OR-1 TaxID=1266765 RepID=UPI000542851C|nr:DUF4388 domain-containing protein [Geobacter sp. OR-1]GAM08194.1 response regulator MprA [Geobacter sp. OR-1]
MSLVGNLKDLGLAEILQIVSLSRKSGVLGIKSDDRDANIVFRQGQVVKATSTSYPVDLAGTLVARGMVDSVALERAKSRQQEEGGRRRLGDILVQESIVEPSVLEELVHGLVEQTVYSLFEWEEGTFDFDLQDNLDTVDDICTDPLQFMLEKGLNAQFLAMEGSRMQDEQRHASSGGEVRKSGTQADENVDFAFDLLKESCPAPAGEEFADVPQIPLKTGLLLIDDDEVIRTALAEILEANGYSVNCFAKGEDALIAIDSLHNEGGTPLVLLDLIMPRMDGSGLLGGLELLELLHSNFPTLKILVMTDRHDAAAERKLAAMGYPLIMKPLLNNGSADAAIQRFGERLLADLSVLSSGEQRPASETFNIGDELRREMGEDSPPPVSPNQSTGISLLRGMLEELNDPALGGGIILLVLRFASEFMARAVIFIVKEDEIVGLGQFGIDSGEQSGDARVRAMRVPLGEETVFSEVVESQLPVKLQMDDSRWCRYLLDYLGGSPKEAFLGPIVSEGKVVAILYGDNGHDPRPIGDTDSLEIFLSQAGIAMEKALLQRKLKEKRLEGM